MGWTPGNLQILPARFRARPFVAGETLASAGDEVTEFWILVEGELDSFLTDARGRESVLGTIRQGETLGEVAILERSRTRPVRLTARTHRTLLAAPAAALLDSVKAYPRVMQNLFHTLSERFKLVAGVGSRSLPRAAIGNCRHIAARVCVGRAAGNAPARGGRAIALGPASLRS